MNDERVDICAAWQRNMLALFSESQKLLQSFAVGAGETWTPKSGLDALQEGFERTFGALWDAVGWAPPRALQRAMADLTLAAGAKQHAQMELLLQLGGAWPRIGAAVTQQLNAQQDRDLYSQRLLDLVRLWTAATEQVIHELLQSERGLIGVARYVRASTQFRQQCNRLVEIASESCNIPTQADVDDALREIALLKRGLKRLERGQRRAPRPAVGLAIPQGIATGEAR